MTVTITSITGGAPKPVFDKLRAAFETRLSAALTTLQQESRTLSASLSTVQIREDFTKETISPLQTDSDNLMLADGNQEGTSPLASQTRQQLSSSALSLALQVDQDLLRLLR